ncbi:histone arginine methyltransferase PRMT2 [Besnoitia besnoiti]|uniref:Histone arginine methyltransferase PRMT2 n=1 Tax=Besnoitia besnoiti TaxID=94643 RepID=A0A2A9MJP7_BESBE|nr:histone arginine methyltransferase PRMT2 [Besnoitia besnoiti]PFH38768.1 histone arginine methyltransferase PRMT2 [Besnoitia besnoiti]
MGSDTGLGLSGPSAVLSASRGVLPAGSSRPASGRLTRAECVAQSTESGSGVSPSVGASSSVSSLSPASSSSTASSSSASPASQFSSSQASACRALVSRSPAEASCCSSSSTGRSPRASPSPSSASPSSSCCAYYASYGDPSVHSYMLRDRPRTSAYHGAVAANRCFLKDSVVMDVGAGSGILSLFAARDGGARRVYALEPSDAFYLLQEIVEANNLQHVILPVHATAEELIEAARARRRRPRMQGGSAERIFPVDREREGPATARGGAQSGPAATGGSREEEDEETEEDSSQAAERGDAGEGDLLEALALREGVSAFLDEQEEALGTAGGASVTGEGGGTAEATCRFVDAIISEWMGFYLLHEGMLDSVLKARDFFLKPKGQMFPTRARLWLSLADCSEYWGTRLQCFSSFHGFNFAPLRVRLQAQLQDSRQPLLLHLKSAQCACTRPALVFDWDLRTIPLPALQYVSVEVPLTALRQAPVHAFALWFDCSFPAGAAEKRQSTEDEVATAPCGDCVEVMKKATRDAGAARESEGEKEREADGEEALATAQVAAEGGRKAMEATPGLRLTCLVNLRKAHERARAYEVEVEVLDAEVDDEPNAPEETAPEEAEATGDAL